MFYYINENSQSNSDHEIHKDSCVYYKMYKAWNNFSYLGLFSSESEALKYATYKYPNYKVDGCFYCCPSIHRT